VKRQLVGIKFTHRPKISIFTLQWRLIALIHVKFGTDKGHVGPLGHTEFHTSQCPGWERGPQNGKNFHFLVKSRPARRGEPFDQFLQLLGSFILLTIQQCFTLDAIHFTGYGVNAKKPCISRLPQIFLCTL